MFCYVFPFGGPAQSAAVGPGGRRPQETLPCALKCKEYVIMLVDVQGAASCSLRPPAGIGGMGLRGALKPPPTKGDGFISPISPIVPIRPMPAPGNG